MCFTGTRTKEAAVIPVFVLPPLLQIGKQKLSNAQICYHDLLKSCS